MAFSINIQDSRNNNNIINAIFINETNVSLRLKSSTPKFIRDTILNKFLDLKFSRKFTNMIFNKNNSCIEFKKSSAVINYNDIKIIKKILITGFDAKDKTLNEDSFLLVPLIKFQNSGEYIGQSPISDFLKF